MLPEIKSLLILQDRDQKILALKKELKRLPMEEQSIKDKLASDTADVATAQGKLNENDLATKTLQLDIETRRNTISRLKTQQYETKKNDEFTALAGEIKRYEEEVISLEDKELELMEVAEPISEELKRAKAALAETQADVDRDLTELNERTAAAKAQIIEIEAAREPLTEGLDHMMLTTYTRLITTKHGVAVSALKHGVCGGCHMKVTSATALAVKARKEPTTCENCGRYLYLEE